MAWLRKINNSIYAVAAALAGVWVWLVTQALFQGAGEAGAFWLVALLLGPFVCTAVHEAGHAVFAVIGGWRVALLHAAPFAWRPSDGRFAVVGALGGQDLAGYCAIMPGSARANRIGYILGVLGGPIASVALAVVALVLAIDFADLERGGGELTPHLLPNGLMALQVTPERQTWLRAISPFFGSVAAQSAYAAVFSLWPARVGNHSNDGALIGRALVRGAASGNALVWVNVALREGVSPRQWPHWIVTATREAMRDDQPPSGSAMCALFIAMDSNTVDAAEARRAVEIIWASDSINDAKVLNWLLAWDALVAALLEADADRAQARFDQIDLKHFGATPETLAARAAILARRNDAQGAADAMAALRAGLARKPLRATAWDRLAALIQAIPSQ